MVAYSTTGDACLCYCHQPFGYPSTCFCNCRRQYYQNYVISTTTLAQEKIKMDEINLRINHLESNLQCYIDETNLEEKIINKRLDLLEKYKEKDSSNPFEYKQVSPKGRDDMRHIQNVLHDFYKWLIINVPENKERSIAVTYLEDAAMWLNKSISRRKDNEKTSC